jgi:ferredoxin-like protein FixX
VLTFKETLKNELKELSKMIVDDKDREYVVMYSVNCPVIIYKRMNKKQIIEFSKKHPVEFLTCKVIDGDVLKG